MPEGAVRHTSASHAPASRCTRQPTRNAEIERFDSIDIVRQRDRRKTPVSVLEALRSRKYAKAQPTAAVRRAQSHSAVRLVLTTGACLAAMLLLVVPLLTLEADAKGGGGGHGGGGHGGGGHGGGGHGGKHGGGGHGAKHGGGGHGAKHGGGGHGASFVGHGGGHGGGRHGAGFAGHGRGHGGGKHGAGVGGA